MDGSTSTAVPTRPPRSSVTETRAYDLALRLPLSLFYLYMLYMNAPALVERAIVLPADGYPLLSVAQVAARLSFLLFISLIVGVTLMRRRPVAKSPGVGARLVAFSGAWLPLVLPLFSDGEASAAALLISAALIMIGNVLSLWTLLWLGRSFSIMAEARRPVMGGPYARIRHPLYVCEMIAIVGIAIQYFSIYAPVLLAAQVALQLSRMHHEERVLAAAFPDYAAYMSRTNRLIPGLY